MIGRRGHVAPERWADIADGRIGGAARERMEAHAAACATCAAGRARVERARAALADIRSSGAPDLGWDHIGARIHWVTSSERHAASRRRGSRADRRALLLLASSGVAAAALALWFLIGSGEAPAPRASEPAPAPARSTPAGPPAPAPAAPALRGLVVLLQGEVSRDGAPLGFDDLLEEGARLVTGDGRVAVQFGPGSGFDLGPGSSLLLRRFDQGAVELVLEGTLAVDVTRRDPAQSFEIIAGERVVRVRGTAFRVSHQTRDLDVACLRGSVIVRDGDDEYDLAAGERLLLDLAGAFAGRAQPLSDAALAELERTLLVPVLPAWSDPDALVAQSAPLMVEAQPGRAVAVDGVEVGAGAFALRVLPGRHHVGPSMRGGGGGGRWLAVEAGVEAVAHVSSKPSPPTTATSAASRRERREQLRAAMEKSARVRRCLESLIKRDLAAGAFVILDLGIDPDGTQSSLNVIESNVPREVESCVRDAVDSVEFPPGLAARFRHRLEF